MPRANPALPGQSARDDEPMSFEQGSDAAKWKDEDAQDAAQFELSAAGRFSRSKSSEVMAAANAESVSQIEGRDGPKTPTSRLSHISAVVVETGVEAFSILSVLSRGVTFFEPVSEHVQGYIRQHYSDSWWAVLRKYLTVFLVGPLAALAYYFIQLPPLEEGANVVTLMGYTTLLTWVTASLSLPVFALWLANWMNDPSCRVKWFCFWICIIPWFLGMIFQWLLFHFCAPEGRNGLFPIPFASVIAVCSIAGPMFGVGYFSFDVAVRANTAFRWRYFLSCTSIAACFLSLGVFVPFLMALLLRSSGSVRLVVAGGMIMCREGLLTIIHRLANKVNPDMSAGSCFHVVLFYQALISSMMQNNVEWYLVALWVGLDIVMNAIYVSLAVTQMRGVIGGVKAETHQKHITGTVATPRVASVVPSGAINPHLNRRTINVIDGILQEQAVVDEETLFRRRQVEILLTLCTFEMAEVLGPLHYLLTSLLKRHFNPRMFEDITHIPDSDFDAGLQTLVLSFFLELTMSIVMALFVSRRFRINVLRLFYCILKMHGWQLLASQVCVMCFVLGLQQHAYYGMDFHLRFNWIGNDGDGTWGGARWIAGNCWQPPDVEETIKCLG